MMTNPHMVFSVDPRYGLVARSGWEQEEARAVLRDLGWEWREELHALLPPNDVPQVNAGVQAMAELHLHGHLTGYSVGPYGTLRLSLARAEQILTVATARGDSELGPATTELSHAQTEPQRSAYLDAAAIDGAEPVTISSEPPAI